MNPGHGGWVIFITLMVAALFNIVHLPEQLPHWLGWLRPNWLLLVTFFWVIEAPQRMSLISIWLFGFFIDALLATPLGLNGMLLAATTYIGWRFFERLRMYSIFQQCGVVFILTLIAEIVRVFVVGMNGSAEFGAANLMIPLMSMLVWPLVYLLLIRLRTGFRVE